jgi:phosphoribosylanthranilate isomerase
MLVQIYGVTTRGDAEMVNTLAPDNVGIVVDEGFGTWDAVDEATARAIASELTDVTTVALSLATKRDRILRTAETVAPGVIHLVRAGEMRPELLANLRDELRPIQLMLTVPVVNDASLRWARHLSGAADYLLLDSADPQSGTVGATGRVHDWSLSRRLVASCSTPSILAGGLGPANVLEAIDTVHPYGVDSETRTSRDDDRRRKDPERVKLFIERARSRV